MTITAHDAMVNGYTKWRSFHCPVHDDNSPSARINTHNGFWVCMVCGAKGSVDKNRIPVDTTLKYIKQLLEDCDERRTYPESYLDVFERPGDYWTTRFDSRTGKELGFLYDPAKEQYGYAIRDTRGAILGIVYRGDFPKYKYPQGVTTSELLFNYHNLSSDKPLFIVEGAPDVAALWEIGVQAVGTFGARLYPAQERLIRRLSPPCVYIAYDMDTAGRTGALGALDRLRAAGMMASVVAWDGAKDAGEMSKETRTQIFVDRLDRQAGHLLV